MSASSTASAHIIALVPLDTGVELSIDRLLKASHAQPSTAVAVAGPLAGGAMSALWRRGFDRVEAARRVTCPCADQLSDLLLIVGCESADQASAVVSAVLPILGPGGTLAIDAGRMTGSGERLRLCGMLAHRGLRYRDGAHVETEIVAHKPEPMDAFAVAS
jgi:hypothetical protein